MAPIQALAQLPAGKKTSGGFSGYQAEHESSMPCGKRKDYAIDA